MSAGSSRSVPSSVIAMISAVLILGVDKKEAKANGGNPAASTSATTAPAPTGAQGDPAAGKQVFASSGCGGCHTLKAAGSSGTTGPDLDTLKPDAALRRAPGDKRRQDHALVQGHAQPEADPGGRGLRRDLHALLKKGPLKVRNPPGGGAGSPQSVAGYQGGAGRRILQPAGTRAHRPEG